MKTIQKGFTLIELLIVIAVLGVLAVAVLSAINPIEQINRSRDTASRSDAEQLLGAIDRFNTTQNRWPWQNADGTNDKVDTLTTVTASVPSMTAGTTVCSMMANLTAPDAITAGCGSDELKQAYVDRITSASGATYNNLNIFYAGDGGGNSVYVCFNPRSGAMKTEAETRCNAASLPTDFPDSACGACPSSLGTGDNCICLP